MEVFIHNLLSRLSEYSASLDKKEIFIDKPWVLIDSELKQQKYIFKRTGDLIMSLNGQATIGKWEYLSTAKCLLIDRIKDKILLTQNFINPAIMVLNKDGVNDRLILVNEQLIPDLDIYTYLKNLHYQNEQITVWELEDGKTMELYDYTGRAQNTKVTIEGQEASDCTVRRRGVNKGYIIKESRIIRIVETVTYKTDRGNLKIEGQPHLIPSKGDVAFLNDLPAPDGKYKLGFMTYLRIKNGCIVSVSIFL